MNALLIITLLLLISCDNAKTILHLNMANTVSPIIRKISEDACGYQNIQLSFEEGGWAHGGELIYKRETINSKDGMNCIGGKGNVYYIRCYDWKYSDGGKLLKKPTRDIPLGPYSCIDESQVEIPYWDKQMQNAEMGLIYSVK